MLNFSFLSLIYKNIFNLITSFDLNKFYTLGFVLGFFFSIQILSGIFLAFLFKNNFLLNFLNVLQISEFEYGYYCRSIHISGTSLLFLLLYMHIIKTFMYAIIINTHISVYFIGLLIYFLTVIIAFLGYVLPSTQMSYWGLTVFSNILSTLPIVGKQICYWIWGTEFINDYTLIKCHILHIVLPCVLVIFIVFHLYYLHLYLSSDFAEDRFVFFYERTIFMYYFLLRDLNVLLNILMLHGYFIFIYWDLVFHEESFEYVNILKTSDKIIPEWFFLTFFGFIKAVPSKLGGIITLLFIMLLTFSNNIFYIYIYMFCNQKKIYITTTYIYLIVFYFVGVLSTNVTILYPFLELLQINVIFLILLFFIKIF